MATENKGQVAWDKLFEKYQILQKIDSNGSFVLKATEIKEFYEPRLMTKFDNSDQLPELFSRNKIAILPITRGSYELGRYEIFHKFSDFNQPKKAIDFQNNYESLDFLNITSESTAISCAYVSRIMQDFIGEELVPTISGRMSSNEFKFSVNVHNSTSKEISVVKSQIEIDGGYETPSSLVLIEAKNFISDDFIVRQLYYPYRRWQDAIRKPVRNIYLTYSNGTFELREYEFTDRFNYNSINLIRCQRYVIGSVAINAESIQEIIHTTSLLPEPVGVPFPQADSFERVINLCELIKNQISGALAKSEITSNYAFDARQTDYYLNAAKYLGLVQELRTDEGKCYCLTEKAKIIFKEDYSRRQKHFIALILSFQAFRTTLQQYFATGTNPSKRSIISNITRLELSRPVNETTASRRASTVSNWVKWIVEQIED